MQEESNLFQVRLNDQGIAFIRRFAAISYSMLALVLFEAIVSGYWNIKLLMTSYKGMISSFYSKIFPFASLVLLVLSVTYNIYLLRFPRVLLRSIKMNDEFGANQAFKLLVTAALFYFFWLLLVTAIMILNFVIR